MEATGFDDIVVDELPAVFSFESLDDYWTLNSEVSGPVALALSTLDDDQSAAVRARSKG